MKRSLLMLVITVAVMVVSSCATNPETSTASSTPPATSAPASTENPTQAPKNSVKNESHEVNLVKVEWTQTLISGPMVAKTHPDEIFLIVYLKTDDPCFDDSNNEPCFEGKMTSWDKVQKACGKVQVAPDEEYTAGGGGVTNGTRICRYIIPKKTNSVMLRLTGYPEIKLENKKE